MRLLLGAFGTRGDVQPLLALALALRARGHQVTLVVPPESLHLAQGFGLEASVAGLNYEDVSRRAASGSIREVLAVAPLVKGEVEAQLRVLEPLADGADLVVGSSVFTAGAILSERLQRPYVFVAMFPVLMDSALHPSPAVPFYRMPRWLNRLSWWVNERLWRSMLLPTMNRSRAPRGLAPMRSVWRAMMGAHPLLAADPALGPAPGDHPFPVSQPGALFVSDPGPLSEPTRAFLEAGPPPAYIGFGSMADPDPKETTLRLFESVRRAGVRAIVSRGWAGLGAEQAPEGVHVAGPEPHAALFPRCLGVVHHGGAGTTHAAARAGVPQVVLPQILDQFYWRHRTEQLGVAAGRVPRYGKDPEPLARALRAFAADQGLRDRARALGQRMVQDGAARAVETLERLAGAPMPAPLPWC